MFATTLKRLIAAAGLALALPAAPAAAASLAVAVSDLNIRTGPAADYQRYGVIPAGGRVQVFGCLDHTNWCDVAFRGERGWVSGNYLATLAPGYDRAPVTRIGLRIGVPFYDGFDPYDYHRRHYAGRAWYRDRYLDDGPRRHWREERREREGWERRRDWREDREDRRD